MLTSISPESRLLLACACYPLQPGEVEHLRGLCSPALDWAALLKLAARHNLIGVLAANLGQHTADLVPPECLLPIQQRAERNRLHALRLAAELNQVAACLAPAGIVIYPLKGPLLSQRLYGDVGLRVTHDLDLLVADAHFPAAEALLQANGYRRSSPSIALTPLQWRIYRRIIHHVAYMHPERQIHVELHWTLSTADLFPVEALGQWMARARSLANTNLYNLSDEDLFCYLVLHGSRHAWSQLKWLADIAMLLRQSPAPDWQAICSQMAELDLLRPLGQALLLACDLFDAAIPAPFATLLEDAVVQRLAQQALGMMSAEHGLGGGKRGRFQRLRSLHYRAGMKAAWRFKIGVLSQLWVVEDDWEDLSLPDWLFPLYFVLRPFLWLRRYHLPKG